MSWAAFVFRPIRRLVCEQLGHQPDWLAFRVGPNNSLRCARCGGVLGDGVPR